MAASDLERKRIEEAVETLFRYNRNPFISNFVRQQPETRIPLGRFDKGELREVIRQVLLGEYRGRHRYVLKIENLVDYLDGLQETGRQHLYLFHLPQEERDELLDQLRDPAGVKKRLQGDEDLYERGRLVWEARDGPELALARHDSSVDAARPEHLLLKWVETRTYWAPQRASEERGQHEEGEPEEEELAEIGTDAETQRVQIQVRREERTVSFLVIHLDSGECEIRIQALRSMAQKARQAQLAAYQALAEEWLGVELVGPTVLAPAIRYALSRSTVPVVHCQAILPDGGCFIGGSGERPPVDVRRLQAGVTIRFLWRPPGGGVARVEVDGRLDEILILNPMLPDQRRLMLEETRRWREEGMRVLSLPDPEVELPPTPAPAGETWLTVLKAALRGSPPGPPSVEPGSHSAILEYMRTHAIELATVAVVEEYDEYTLGEREAAVPAADTRVLTQFLKYIEEVAQAELANYEAELQIVRTQERWSFNLMIVAAAIALGFVSTAGALLLFSPGNLTIDAVVGVLGVLTGRVTFLIRSYLRELRTKRELIQKQHKETRDTLIAVQAALSTSDPTERAREMSRVIAQLLANAAVRHRAEVSAEPTNSKPPSSHAGTG